MEEKNMALVILGIIAVIAMVGLVMLFAEGKKATGEGIYGGAIKGVAYPNWEYRGAPQGQGGLSFPEGKTATIGENPNRDPSSDVPSALTGCGANSILVDVNSVAYYEGIGGYTCFDARPDKPGYCCYPNEALVGGTI